MGKENFGGSGKPKTKQRWVIHKNNKTFIPPPEGNVKFTSLNEVKNYLDNDLLYCLECGKSFIKLGMHLARSHAMHGKEYKIKYGIPLTFSLAGKSYIEKHSLTLKDAWKNPTPARMKIKERLESSEFTEKYRRSPAAEKSPLFKEDRDYLNRIARKRRNS